MIQAASASQRFGHPETTGCKCTLAAAQPIVRRQFGIIAMHECIAGQFFLNVIDGAKDTRVVRTCKLGDDHEQYTGIDGITSIILDKAVVFLIPAFVHDLLMDAVASWLPRFLWGGH